LLEYREEQLNCIGLLVEVLNLDSSSRADPSPMSRQLQRPFSLTGRQENTSCIPEGKALYGAAAVALVISATAPHGPLERQKPRAE
jgi:hypothetical protein